MSKFEFLNRGGEMGDLTRNYDWKSHSLGEPNQWPQSLQTTVGIILHSAFPMFLFWGKDLVCFYNDAYRPSLGLDGKHPALGKPAKDVWPEIWYFIGPLIEKVLHTGEAAWFEDQLLPIYRNGKMEDVYWTFSYSPAYNDQGEIGGVFVTCTETTRKINAQKELAENSAKFRALVEEAPVGTCLFTGRDMKVEIINDIMVGYWGKGHTVLGKPLVEALPELKDQPFLELLDTVYTTGKAYVAKGALVELEVDGIKSDYYYDFTYKPVRNSAGEVFGIINVSIDATDRVLAEQQLANSQKQLLSYFEQSPVAIATIGKDHLTFRLVNPFYADLVGRTPDELIDKPLLEALPELRGQGFDDLLRGVIESGKPYIANEVSVDLKRNGKLENIFVNLTYAPQRDVKGEVIGILVVATDVTQQVHSRRKVEESGARLRTMIEQTPAPTLVLMGDSLVVEQINEPMLQMIGRGKEVIGVPLITSMPELEGQYVWEQVKKVYKEGVNFDQSEVFVPHYRNGVMQDYYYNIAYRPLKEEGKITGMIQVAIDVTEQVVARQKVEEKEAHLQLTRDAVPAMIFYMDEEQRYRSYNGVFMNWFNVNATEALGKTTREFIGEAAYAKAAPLLAKAYKGERVEYHMHAPQRIGGEKWLNIVYTPHKIDDEKVVGVIVHATDITEHMLALKKIELSEARFRNLLQEAPVAATLFRGPELIIEIANDLTLKYWGKDKGIIGKPLAEAAPELRDQQLIDLVKGVYERGGMESYTETPIQFIENGVLKNGYYSFSIKALYDSFGEVESILSTGIDVTEQVNVRKQIEQSEKELRDLINAAPIGICVLSGSPVWVEEVNDRFLLIAGKTREQFENAPYWEVMNEIAQMFERILENVFKTGIRFTSEEHEMTLIRGGVAEKIYATFEYVPVLDTNNIVTKVILMAVEVSHQVEIRKQIEDAVITRTKELAESNLQLKRSNEELEEFAYIASHDLQEPVRKISTFTQLLERSIKDIDSKSQDYISKIYNSTDRMTKLIRDVLAFSQVSQQDTNFEKVNLSKILQSVETDFDLMIQQKGATIHVDPLPVIDAVPSQMIQLFSNLLSNSLKYSRKDIKPIINIIVTLAKKEKLQSHPQLDPRKKYHHITFSDNGIGFDQEHADRIFKIFQRLHGKTDYEGTGIGLAICRKIVHKHLGHIAAAAGENGGAVFNILLPVAIH